MAKRAAKKKSTSKRSAAKRSAKRVKKTRATAKRSAKRAVPRSKRSPARAAKTAKRKTAARAAASRSSRKGKRRIPEPSRLASAAVAVRGAVAGAVAAVAGRLPWSSGGEDAITLLETDHRLFEKLLKQGEETTDRAVRGRTALLHRLTAELNVHELIEEKILYPALKEHPEAKDIVLEGYQEHHVADILVKELHELARDDEQWGAKFKVLKESIEHHIGEEEHKMFRTARGLFSREDLEQMGARMERMKAES